jgi:hypothetical protein
LNPTVFDIIAAIARDLSVIMSTGNFNHSFHQISPAPASTNHVSGMMKNQGFLFHRPNAINVAPDVPKSTFPSSREESDKASAALALSALAGSKRTHSPTCVTESFSHPPLDTSTPSNHSLISKAKMTLEKSPEMISNYRPFDNHGAATTDPRKMLSSMSSATITPFDPCKRMKISPETSSHRLFVPTPPLPGARHSSGSAFLSRGSRPLTGTTQHPIPLVHHSMSNSDDRNSGLPNAFAEKERITSFLAITQGSIPSSMSSLRNHVNDPSASCQDMMSYDDDMDIPPNQQLLPDGTYKRKDKSLGVLCVNFMLRYNNMKVLNPDSIPSVSIDEASAYLAVERRRIYDIINILESINVVSRKCKNTYNWHGMDGILDTFFSLQKEGVRIFEQDAIKTGFKAKMEEKGIKCQEEKIDEGKQQLMCNVSTMPTGLAMLLAGGKSFRTMKIRWCIYIYISKVANDILPFLFLSKRNKWIRKPGKRQ